MAINKRLFIISLMLLALIPVGFVILFMKEWYNFMGASLVFAGMFVGLPLMLTSLDIQLFGHICNNDDEIIERLDKIEKSINNK